MSDCKTPIPTACGRRGLHLPQPGCKALSFYGTRDMTINQGDDIDLSQGVHAIDGNGNEVPFTVVPSEITTCANGVYEITYTAEGVTNDILPTFCGSDKRALSVPSCRRVVTEVVTRKITVKPVTAKVCEAKVCCSSVGCSPNRPYACEATACITTLAC